MTSNDDLRTDACPSPPRDLRDKERDMNPKIEVFPEGPAHKQGVECDETTQHKTDEKPGKSPKTGARAKTHSDRKKKDFGQNRANCSYNVLSVNNSNGVHFGNTYVYNGKECDNSHAPKAGVYKNEEILKAMDSPDLVQRQHITYVSTHVGEGWRNIARLLDYSDGQIDQFYENHHISGVREVVYQMLLDWTRTQPETATVGRLANVLWDCEQRDCVSRLADRFFKKR